MNSGPWSGVAPLQHEDRTKRGFLRVTASIGVGTLVSLIAPVASNAAETTGPEPLWRPPLGLQLRFESDSWPIRSFQTVRARDTIACIERGAEPWRGLKQRT